MKQAGTFWQHLQRHKNTHWVILAFSLATWAVTQFNLTFSLPNTLVSLDGREFFVVLGAALTNPAGALILGLVAGLAEPAPGFYPISILYHTLGALFISWAFPYLVRKSRGKYLLSIWILLCTIYYFVILSPISMILCQLLAPDLYIQIFRGGPIFEIYSYTVLNILWKEWLFTLLTSSSVLIILPPQLIFQDRGPDFPVLQSKRHHLVFRLSALFLLLTILPVFSLILTLAQNLGQEQLTQIFPAFYPTILVSLLLVTLIHAVIVQALVGQPLKKLTAIARTIGEGDFTRPVDTHLLVDELQILGNAFSDTNQRLNTLITRFEKNLATEQEIREALRLSEEKYRLIIESQSDLIVKVDLEGRLLYVNPQYCRTFGKTTEELIGNTYMPLIHEDDREATQKAVDSLYSPPHTCAVEQRCLTVNGWRWIAWRDTLVFDENQQPQSIIGVGVDVTERRQAQEALKANEAQWYNTILHLPVAMAAYRFDTQKFFLFNQRFEELFGYTHEDLDSVDDWWPLAYPDETYRQQIREEWAQRHQEALDSQRETIVPVEARVRCKNGELRYIRFFMTHNGNTAIVTLIDITQNRQLEESLRQSEERYRLLADLAPMPVIMTRLDGTFNYLNQAAANMHGYSSPSELIGQNSFDWIAPECRARAAEDFRRLICGDNHEYQYILLHKDGSRFPARVHSAIIPDGHGTPNYMVILPQDITAQKQFEEETQRFHAELEQRVQERTAQLQASNKELESFAYSISHDLRAPLRAIDGFSLTLLEDYFDQLDETGKGYLHRVRASAQRMGQLIDDLLSLSRVSRTELHIHPVDLSQMAGHILSELQELSPERQVVCQVTPNLTAQADSGLIQIVLENLLGNAWKFTSQHPTALIEFGQTQIEGKNAFFVRDDGAGFEMQYAAKMFGVFQRLHAANEFPGTGIGLATVQRILERHGGKIWGESAPECGATFYFTLP